MKVAVIDELLTYDGLQLSTAFVDQHAPQTRDTVILFEGPADVPLEHMVDLDDVAAGEGIYSPLMAHLVIEHADIALREAVCRQRLLMRLAASWLSSRSGTAVQVRGDDLWVGEGKLSVSIATTSPRSCLVHAGINVETEGTPVRTAGLRELRIPTWEFLRNVSRAYVDEVASIAHAVAKVRPVT